MIGVGTKGAIWSGATTDPQWRDVGTAHGTVQAITVTDSGDMLVVNGSGISPLPST